jgi:hypothetical protein
MLVYATSRVGGPTIGRGLLQRVNDFLTLPSLFLIWRRNQPVVCCHRKLNDAVMQLTSLRDRNGVAERPAIDLSNGRRALNLALVYQDTLTRQWAGQVRDRMAQAVGQEQLRCTEWQVSNLKERGPFSKGVAALAQADAIVVSLREAERLLSTFYLWVNVWLQERAGRPGVLVALMLPPEEPNSGANETRRYLYAVASQGHLDFLGSSGKFVPRDVNRCRSSMRKARTRAALLLEKSPERRVGHPQCSRSGAGLSHAWQWDAIRRPIAQFVRVAQ